MIRRPPRSTLDRSSAASDVYKRQEDNYIGVWAGVPSRELRIRKVGPRRYYATLLIDGQTINRPWTVSYTHLRAHETVLDLVCRLLLEKKKKKNERRIKKKKIE